MLEEESVPAAGHGEANARGARMPDDLTYQEILRTIGILLEIANARDVRIVLADQAATVSGPSWHGPSEWSVADLATESSDQRTWRFHPRPDKTPRAGILANCLRSIGAIIDMRGGSPYTIDLEPTQVHVRGPDAFTYSLGLIEAEAPTEPPSAPRADDRVPQRSTEHVPPDAPAAGRVTLAADDTLRDAIDEPTGGTASSPHAPHHSHLPTVAGPRTRVSPPAVPPSDGPTPPAVVTTFRP